jgi:ATP-binding cassette, subfamily C, bacteriocin exporter
MKRGNLDRYEKAFIPQLEQSDCGVACLASAARFFGGDVRIGRLREISGTGKQGTTLLGLFEAAQASGFSAEAFSAGIDDLKDLKNPCILHVLMEKRLQHYVICYGWQNDHFIISDPAKGVARYTASELEEIWISKALLVLQPGEHFVKASAIKREKLLWLRRLIEADSNILGVALFLGIAITVLSLSTAIFSQKLIDDILPNKKELKLAVGLSLLLFLLLVRSLVSYIRQYFLLRQTKDFNNRIITDFYGKLLRLPKSFFDSRKVGELVARMNDTGRIQNAISYMGASLVIDVLLVIFASVFLLAYSPALGLLGLASIPLLFAITYAYHRKIVRSQKEVMQMYAMNEANYVDTIQGIRDIKSLNREEQFTGSTRKIYNVFQDRIYDLGKVRIGFNLATEISGTLLMVGIITWGSMFVLDNQLRPGELMAVIQMTGMLMPAAGRLALTNIQLQEARVAFDRMFEFTSVKPEYDPSEEKEKHQVNEFRELELDNVSFRFPGRQRLLKDVSFRLAKGEMIAILGESGSGKSTTLQVLERFYFPAGGSIKANGIDWGRISTPAWRAITSSVPQDIKLFSGTLAENICPGISEAEAVSVIEFCKAYGFHHYFMQFPQGYSTILGEDGINISGGQQQLVAIARALYKKPQLLLMDEPTSAMDRNTEGFIMDLLQGLRNEMAIIMVTHRIRTAKRADRIYVLENGSITTRGNHDELLQGENLYSLSWRDQ